MHQVLSILQTICRRVGTPLAKQVSSLVAKGDWAELQRLRADPHAYNDAESYWRDALCVDFLRKADLPTRVDKKRVAKELFFTNEHANAVTHARLIRYLHQGDLVPSDLAVLDFIAEWRKEIRRVVGRPPAVPEFHFTGGSTVGDPRVRSTIPDKMSNRPQWYKGAIGTLSKAYYDSSWSRASRSRGHQFPTTSRGNHFFSVPKDGTKERGCAKEASLAVAAQRFYGAHLRDRVLPRLGIRLRTDQEKHNELACYASMDGEHATLDMSSASDLWCTMAVKLGLPSDWFTVLSSLRATHTRIDGKWHFLYKFSSMGNGFTFELETLLFATLARTVVQMEGGDPSSVSCYGDDLIVPTKHARGVIAALKFFGHQVNEKKSFVEGPFRESCGGDYFNGDPVTGVKLEKLPDEPQQWIALANSLRRVCAGFEQRWALVRPAWREVLNFLPSQIQECRGPSHLGDLVIHDEPEFWKTRNHSRDGAFQEVRAYAPVSSSLPLSRWGPEVILSCCTLISSEGVTPRDSVTGYRLRWVYTHSFPKPEQFILGARP